MPPVKKTAAKADAPTSKTSSKTRTFQFFRDKETTGAWRYSEKTPEGEKGLLRTVYLRKELYQELGEPENLEVTVKVI